VLWAGIAVSQEAVPFLAERHQKQGLSCAACHKEDEPKTPASGAACLVCHKSLDAVAERTKDFEKNPHSNHITQVSEVECTQCHKGHKEIAPLCHQCHAGMTFEKSEAHAQ
jgi:fumarate reductase flavoprotein subunit